jgi:serine/threonine protein kinase
MTHFGTRLFAAGFAPYRALVPVLLVLCRAAGTDAGAHLRRQAVTARAVGTNYTLDEFIGRGAMGEVWRATRRDGTQVAIKLLRPDLLNDPDIVARFVQERTILTKLDDDHIVGVIDLVVEYEEATLAIVMDLVEGGNLRDRLRGSGITRRDALEVAAQIADALSTAHDEGVIHRDIKPENILLDVSQPGIVAKLTDFGIAKITEGPSLTRLSGVTVGTAEYIAPESAENGEFLPQSDIYSLGIVLYEMLSGVTPFGGAPPLTVMRRHLQEAPPALEIERGVWSLLEEMLAKDPARRPHDGRALARRLRDAAVDVDPTAGVLAGPPAMSPVTPFPTIEPVEDAPGTKLNLKRQKAEPIAAETPVEPSTPRSRKALVGVGLGVAALLVAFLLASMLPDGSDQPADESDAVVIEPETVSHSFPAFAASKGVAVERTWTVTEDGIEGVVVVRNASGAPIERGRWDEALPQPLAGLLVAAGDAARLDPPGPEVLERGVIRWVFEDLDDGESIELRYFVPTDEPVSESELDELAAAQPAAEASYKEDRATAVAASTLETLTIAVPQTTLPVGQSMMAELHGGTLAGTEASAAMLEGAVWSSDNPAVLAVLGNGIAAVGPGTANVTATVGDVATTVTITVDAPATPVPVAGSSPTTRPRPRPTTTVAPPSNVPTPTPTPVPTPTPSPRPTTTTSVAIQVPPGL